MPNSSKDRGDRFEAAVRDHLATNGFPWVQRTRAGYARDHGDLHLDPTSGEVIAQCKNHARICLPEWLGQLADQTDAADARHGFLVVKRRGVGDPGRSYVVLELDAMIGLLRAAGYGSLPDQNVAAS